MQFHFHIEGLHQLTHCHNWVFWPLFAGRIRICLDDLSLIHFAKVHQLHWFRCTNHETRSQYFKDPNILKGLGNKQKKHLKHLVGATLEVEIPPPCDRMPCPELDSSSVLELNLAKKDLIWDARSF